MDKKSKYYLKFKRKFGFFKKVDTWDLYGPEEYHHSDPTYCSIETQIYTRKLESFTDKEEAKRVLDLYKESECHI